MMNEQNNVLYIQLSEIDENPLFTNREKLLLLFNLVKEAFQDVTVKEKISFTEFALFNFIIYKYQFNDELKKQLVNFRKLISKIKKQRNFLPKNDTVKFYFQIARKFLDAIYENKILTEIEEPIILHDFSDIDEPLNTQTENLNVKCNFISKTLNNDSVSLLCTNENGERISIKVSPAIFTTANMIWKSCSLYFTNLKLSEQTISDTLTDNETTLQTIHYEATNKTQITVEPDYLIDVTEVVECFTHKEEYPIIPILNKFLNRSAGVAAFRGNIVNSFFDELIENIEIDFHTALKKAFEKKTLNLLVILQFYKSKDLNISNLDDLLKFFRTELYDIFDNLRNIIIANYMNKNTYVEPSFISNVFGLQGRLDLMVEYKTNPKNDYYNVDIVELKSGKAPNNEIKTAIGLTEKRILVLPLWVNHYVQIICYNMLLQPVYSACSNKQKGLSAILYSSPEELKPIRSVVDNFFVQNEILTMRNWIVAFMRELALGNLSIIETINYKHIAYFPAYLQEDVTRLIDRFANLNDLEKSYFKTQISFLTKEIFANKIGLFTNNQYSTNKFLGFSSLWLLSEEEKILKGILIPNLVINKNESDFYKMHIVFDINSPTKKHSAPVFRKGDICILYPANNDCEENSCNNKNNIQMTSQQLLRGRIIQINDTKLIVSFRNKLSQNIINSAYQWCLEADYIESMNNYAFASVSNFIFRDFENKKCILGIEEPQFEENNDITQAAETITDLTTEKQTILKTALSAKNYFLIQGPPGTGKTSYMLRYLTQILFQYTTENILILAYTNRAVDEICESIERINSNTSDQLKFDFIRLGNKDSSEHSDKLISNIPLDKLEECVTNCRCFVSTVVTANSTPELFQLKKFDTIIIDEAAQILESSILGLLSNVKRFIMIGDEKQLPAVTTLSANELIVQDELMHNIGLNNLGTSLFERILKVCKQNNWNAFAMLQEQSRMSEDIMRLANNLSYQNKLKASDYAPDSNIHKVSDSSHSSIITKSNCIFIDTKLEPFSTKTNFSEVEIIIDLIAEVKMLYGESFNQKTLGIISPWRRQCNEILNRLSDIDKQIITVDTVERFQGSEREVIIFSAATNNLHLLDLLSESKLIDDELVDRKLNVAITRAKHKFILLGNYELLCKKEVYRKLIKQIIER